MPNPWPHGAKCAISFTMDNLGEAQAVHNKTWPADKPTGQDPSVLETLPRILDILAKAQNNTTTTKNNNDKGVRATYFAEAWSLPTYPAAVADLQRRGHEVAWHGYQHEVWHALSAAEEEASFERSFGAARDAGVRYAGFRPPGGRINGARTMGLFRRFGVGYVSPLGKFGVERCGDGEADVVVVVLPFEWEAVDAFWYMDKFGGIRREHGVQEGPLGPAEFRGYLLRRIEEVKREGGYMSILFHPFLTTDEERMKLLGEIVDKIGRDPDVWCAPCGEVADWVRDHSAEFGFK
ncbi:hypothetical protein DHEL01_v205913 [Diaporthe helianthi]|uniref:NodB homology domain-containing protein n=1 Tax=Diaporthe helianthi TaxID=158607 RepID=A0A2P5HZL5_DIAHE|nr:hypothetical protein DHEL01_v205913 [Diaporthe helianthi]